MATEKRGGAAPGGAGRVPTRSLAVIDFPVALGVKSHLKQTVLGIVTLAAAGTLQITAPRGALVIIVLCDGERSAAAAGDEEHAQMCCTGVLFLHGISKQIQSASSTVSIIQPLRAALRRLGQA